MIMKAKIFNGIGFGIYILYRVYKYFAIYFGDSKINNFHFTFICNLSIWIIALVDEDYIFLTIILH